MKVETSKGQHGPVHIQALGRPGLEAVASWLVRRGHAVTPNDVAEYQKRWSGGIEAEGEAEELAVRWFTADNFDELTAETNPDVEPRPAEGTVLPVNAATLRAAGMRPVRFLDDPRAWLRMKLKGEETYVPRR